MKLVFTLAARADLRAIGDFIAQDSPHRALTFVDELEQHCDKLTTMPRAHPLLTGHEKSGIRKAVHRNYLIFYRLTADAVDIIHILHGARDWERLLFGDEAS